MHRLNLRSACLAAAFCASASGLQAQSFGGNFNSGPAVTAPAPTAQPPAQTGGGFGGSFDGGSFGDGSGAGVAAVTPPGQTQPGATPPTGPSVGGADFPGGSFDPPGGTTPGSPPAQTPGATPPTQQVTQPPVQQQTGPQIDPQVTAFETRDWGVAPTDRLRNGQFHAATPTAIPGGAVVTTQGLMEAMQGGVQMVLIDVLGGQYSLPNAFIAPALAQAGSFSDATQQQAAQWLNQITGGNTQIPIVVFCSDPQCWLSYNAALRSIAAGYQAVYWYRGGIQAWQIAGLPMQPAAF